MRFLSSLSVTTHLVMVLALTVALGHTGLQAQNLCGSDNYYNCHPGDANGDGSRGINDAVYLISYIFVGGWAPVPWSVCNGDANGDCVVNISDAVHLIVWIFQGGPSPVTCAEFEASCPDPGNYTGS